MAFSRAATMIAMTFAYVLFPHGTFAIEPMGEEDFLQFNVELSRLAHQAAAGKANEAIAGYLKLLSVIEPQIGLPGPWNGLLPHLGLYIRYQMNLIESTLRPLSVCPWAGDVERQERERKRHDAVCHSGQLDAAFCRNLAQWLDNAARVCDARHYDEAVREYDAILDRLEQLAQGDGLWAHPEYHLRRFVMIRRSLVAARILRRQPSQAAVLQSPGTDSFQPTWRLPFAVEVGTRITGYTLTKPRHEYFLGSINKFEAEQDYWPYKVFLALWFNSWLGVEGTWDKIRAKTVTDYDDHTDGAVRASGPIITLQGRYVNNSIFTPYAGAGLTLYSSRFDADPVWHNGFGKLYRERGLPWSQAVADYEAWVAAGSPEWPNDGYQREMELSKGIGFALLAGCQIQITDRVSADFMLRYVYLEVDVEYRTLRYGKLEMVHDTTTFPLSHIAAGLGVRVAF